MHFPIDREVYSCYNTRISYINNKEVLMSTSHIKTNGNGYTIDNLQLPVWIVAQLAKESEGKSIHFALQKVLKAQFKDSAPKQK